LALVPKSPTDSLCSDTDLQTITLEALLTDIECCLEITRGPDGQTIVQAACLHALFARPSPSQKSTRPAASTPSVDALPAITTAGFDAIGKGVAVGSRRCYFGPKIAIFRRLQGLAVGQP
jgi:hypothetical protein